MMVSRASCLRIWNECGLFWKSWSPWRVDNSAKRIPIWVLRWTRSSGSMALYVSVVSSRLRRQIDFVVAWENWDSLGTANVAPTLPEQSSSSIVRMDPCHLWFEDMSRSTIEIHSLRSFHHFYGLARIDGLSSPF